MTRRQDRTQKDPRWKELKKKDQLKYGKQKKKMK